MGPGHLKGCPALISGGINQVCLPMNACSSFPQSRQWQVLHLIKTGAVTDRSATCWICCRQITHLIRRCHSAMLVRAFCHSEESLPQM